MISSYLYWFVGVEEHDRYKGKYFLSHPVARPRQVRQSLRDGPHLIQFHLDAANQRQMSAHTTHYYIASDGCKLE